MEPRRLFWLRDTTHVWFGYILTALAALPASAVGMWLISKGVGRQTGVLISIALAVLGGFLGEAILSLRSRKRHSRRLVISLPNEIGYQLNWGRTFTVASFVLVVTSGPVRASTLDLPITGMSASSFVSTSYANTSD